VHGSLVGGGQTSVADAAAALKLMADFHSRLGEKAEVVALQEAMLEMREQRELPYYWAPFTLVGDWR